MPRRPPYDFNQFKVSVCIINNQSVDLTTNQLNNFYKIWILGLKLGFKTQEQHS